MRFRNAITLLTYFDSILSKWIGPSLSTDAAEDFLGSSQHQHQAIFSHRIRQTRRLLNTANHIILINTVVIIAICTRSLRPASQSRYTFYRVHIQGYALEVFHVMRYTNLRLLTYLLYLRINFPDTYSLKRRHNNRLRRVFSLN